MAQKRPLLPRKRNPLISVEKTPDHERLVETRRLGQTDLKVKVGQINTTNATMKENLGVFNYAHLRAPLPENLRGSEIFEPAQSQPRPEAYFLMRRGIDGYVSATGMFKAAFPWAKHDEEQLEREYIKSFPRTDRHEVAGNIWVPPDFALDLAEEYGISAWIRALLDPEDIVGSENPTKSISPPPKFEFKANDKTHLPPPGTTPRARGRPRGGSPAKSTTTATKNATPRKPRTTKTTKDANAANAREASASLQNALDSAASVAESESVNGETVTVEVDSAVEVNGETETTHTNVRVEMPAGSPDLALPTNTEDMITKAKEMVEEAKKLDGADGSSARGSKRKAEVLDDDEDDEEGDQELQPAKRARLLQAALKKEKVRNRALIGVVATFAVGAILPYMM